MSTQRNRMQERQVQAKCQFVVSGVADWQDCLAVSTKLNEFWARRCGGAEVPLIDYVRKEAELNVDSFERSVITAFLNSGYQLEELEVEIDSSQERPWGKCVWYKEHPNYAEPLDEMFKGSALNNPAFFHATFKTEHVGDQKFCIYSLQMMMSTSILLHKTLVYHKVVFSPPQPKAKAESAAA